MSALLTDAQVHYGYGAQLVGDLAATVVVALPAVVGVSLLGFVIAKASRAWLCDPRALPKVGRRVTGLALVVFVASEWSTIRPVGFQNSPPNGVVFAGIAFAMVLLPIASVAWALGAWVNRNQQSAETSQRSHTRPRRPSR